MLLFRIDLCGPFGSDCRSLGFKLHGQQRLGARVSSEVSRRCCHAARAAAELLAESAGGGYAVVPNKPIPIG